MDITPLLPEGQQIVESYGPGRFKVTGQLFQGPILVRPTKTEIWPIADFSKLSVNDFSLLFDGQSDILLLGCGARALFVPPTLRQALKEKGLVVEAMDSGAACRTFNVLMMEGRAVAAALIPLPQ